MLFSNLAQAYTSSTQRKVLVQETTTPSCSSRQGTWRTNCMQNLVQPVAKGRRNSPMLHVAVVDIHVGSGRLDGHGLNLHLRKKLPA